MVVQHQAELGEDEAVHKELGDSLVRAATTASSLEAVQDSGNITKTRSNAIPNESSSLRTTLGGGPRCQETMRDTIAQTRVLDLDKTKTTQQNEIASLKRRVKKLEYKKRSRTHGLKKLRRVGATTRIDSFEEEEEEVLGEDASKHGRINAIDANDEITLVNVQEDADAEMFDVVTLAQALAALKSVKPKVKGVVIREPSTTTTISSLQSQDKGKGIMVEEPVKTMKKKDLIRLDEEIASKLQAKFDEEERLAREKDKKEQEANVALIEEW
ncbi:hypothetical protein Tco_1357926, partial [Tanacetum coccineum]